MTKKCSCQWFWMSHSLLLPTKTGIGVSVWTAFLFFWRGWIFSSFLHQLDGDIPLTDKFPFLECGRTERWAGTQRRRSGAFPLRGSPDLRRDRCWNRHCEMVGGVTGAHRRPAWRSRLPGAPDFLSPGKAQRWRVWGGSWSCVQGRDARASSRRLSGPIHCTQLYSFRSLPHQGASECLRAEDRQQRYETAASLQTS